MQLHGDIVLGTDVFGHQIHLGHRHIQRVALIVLQLDIILHHALHRQLLDSLIQPNTVRRVHNIVAYMQLGQTVDLRALVAAARAHLAPLLGDAPVGDDANARIRVLGTGG